MSKGKSERTMQMKQDREAGMTCKEIAEKHGTSYQQVQCVVGQYSPEHFRTVTEIGCIYPLLRRWMNDNKVGKREMLRRMGLEAYPLYEKEIMEAKARNEANGVFFPVLDEME